jgi:SWI/SNF-related matrix-associated actin-dependent regulator 1 of chromatin subfamily A
LDELLENEIKFLFFAHHVEVLDEVEKHLNGRVQFIRIDGSVALEKRHLSIHQFQEREDVRVALLSITAASTGITLTAASTIIFGEMHWTPAMMLQAEDRAHRIG